MEEIKLVLKAIYQEIYNKSGFKKTNILYALRASGQSPIEESVNEATQDINENDEITLNEFLKICDTIGLKTKKEQYEQLNETLEYFDKNDTNIINWNEMKLCLFQFGFDEKELKEMKEVLKIPNNGECSLKGKKIYKI
ncbi:hypothetical protein A3Q56_00505 [Intoshia linei]|uniref:EF-hand domain-containing protein n=1 Tax=Intoshia linei TaxID=1819745 RepID=A0A177BBL8_9BILA|nr:hypothetical protein A3Q56_00505 [Intoshia linei]